MLAIALAAMVVAASSQSGSADFPEPLLRAFRARPPSFRCTRKEAPPNTFTLTCIPICTHPPKAFSVRELVALEVSPKEAPELAHFSAEQYDEWHRYCDKHTS